MAIEKVRPVKQESAATGGDAADDVEYLNAPANPNEDALTVRGLYLQKDTGDDSLVLLTRDGSGNMTFQDQNQGSVSLSTLAVGGVNQYILDVAGSFVYVDDGDLVKKA